LERSSYISRVLFISRRDSWLKIKTNPQSLFLFVKYLTQAAQFVFETIMIGIFKKTDGLFLICFMSLSNNLINIESISATPDCGYKDAAGKRKNIHSIILMG